MKIPYNLDYPKPQKIDRLSGIHGVSSENIVVVDAQTLLIPEFSYDGEAPGKLYDNFWSIFDIKQLYFFKFFTSIQIGLYNINNIF